MNASVKAPVSTPDIAARNALVVDSAQDIKANTILLMDLRALDERPTDFFVICSGTSTTQVRGIADNIYRRLRDEADVRPLHREGEDSANWVCLDYGDLVVHVFSREAREYYDLESLWSDARIQEYQTL